MKSLSVLLIATFYSLICFSQKPIRFKHTFAYPVFLDAKKMDKDLAADTTIRRQYLSLKKEHDYQVYHYGFILTRTGKVTAIDTGIDIVIKNFIEKKFKYYTWIAGHKRYQFKKKLQSCINLQITLVPENRMILYLMNIGDCSFHTRIRVIDREIEMDE